MIQDEIREGLYAICRLLLDYGATENCRAVPSIKLGAATNGVSQILTYLDSKGCVISIPDSPDEPDDFYYGEKGPPIIKDGMAIVKPLIKE